MASVKPRRWLAGLALAVLTAAGLIAAPGALGSRPAVLAGWPAIAPETGEPFALTGGRLVVAGPLGFGGFDEGVVSGYTPAGLPVWRTMLESPAATATARPCRCYRRPGSWGRSASSATASTPSTATGAG